MIFLLNQVILDDIFHMSFFRGIHVGVYVSGGIFPTRDFFEGLMSEYLSWGTFFLRGIFFPEAFYRGASFLIPALTPS